MPSNYTKKKSEKEVWIMSFFVNDDIAAFLTFSFVTNYFFLLFHYLWDFYLYFCFAKLFVYFHFNELIIKTKTG